MGTTASSGRPCARIQPVDSKVVVDAVGRHREIEQQLAVDRVEDMQRVKLLLLGAAESGKSTFVKQMRILHLNGFSDRELLACRSVIYANVATAVQQLLDGAQLLGIASDDLSKQDVQNFRLLTNEGRDDYEMSPAIGALVKRMWLSDVLQNAFEKRNQFQLLDSAHYFLENIDRISDTDYVPNSDDILRSRAATTGIYEVAFKFRAKNFRLVDVGGQRTERRKWIHCFDNVTALMFIASLAEYDLQLTEDSTVNRLDDSLALFEFITKSRYFTRTAVLLFLNKKDILKEKIKRSPLSNWCPQYNDSQTYEEASQCILQEYVKRKPPDKPLYSYFTDATDTRNIDIVFNASVDIILSNALSSVGFH